MGSMSYCQFHNGAEEMNGILTKLRAGEVADWSEEEVRAVKRIFTMAEEILEYNVDIIDAIEALPDYDDDDEDDLLVN